MSHNKRDPKIVNVTSCNTISNGVNNFELTDLILRINLKALEMIFKVSFEKLISLNSSVPIENNFAIINYELYPKK